MKNAIITTKLPVGKQPKTPPLGGRGWLRLTIFPLVLALLATSWNGRAASISWGTPTDVSGPSDVMTSGTLVGSAAYQGDITTAGMTFTGYKGSYGTPGKVGQSYYLIFNNITFDVSGGIGNTPSSNYTDLYAGSSMGSMVFLGSAGTSPAGIDLLGLTVGHQYEVQIWSQSWGANWTAIYGDTNGNNVTLNQQGASTGQFVVGTFTADGTDQIIYMICQANGYAFPPGAVQVRDISPLAVSIQPASPAAAAGSTVTINAVALYGSGTYTYQWYQNGTNLVGQTGSSLILNSVTLGMNGYTYAVEVGDGTTNVTSVPVELTVGTAKLFNVNVGSLTMTGAAVLGASNDYWATINVLGSAIAVPDASGSSVAGVTFEVAGTTGLYGDDNNNPNPLDLMHDYAYLGSGTFTGTYTNLSAYNGCNYNLIVYASGNNLNQGSIVTVNGQTLEVAGDSRDITSGVGHAYQIFTGTIANGQLAISVAPGPGGYAVLDGAQLQVVVPPSPLTATISPNNAAVVAGSTVTLGAVAIGGSGTYAYQWYQVGVGSLTGQTNAALVLSDLTTNQTATSYYAVVTDGSTYYNTANATLTVTPSLAQVLNAPYAPGLPVDANPAHWAGLGASSVYMDTSGFTNGTPRSPGDLGVTMQYAWDYTNLYILVRENTNFVTAGSQQEATSAAAFLGTGWEWDSVAFWMDFQNICGTTINGAPVSNYDAEHTLFTPWSGFSSTGLTGLLYNQSSGATANSYAGLTNAVSATSGTFAAHNRTLEVALAWKDIAGLLPTDLQPGGSLLAAVKPGYKFGSEPLLVYNSYSAQCFMGGTNNPGNPWSPPSGVDTNSVDVQLVLVPTLQATLAGGEMVIRWPVAATGSLYTSPVLGAGATWTKVTSPAPVVDPNDSSKMKWTGPVTGTEAFYRLQ